MDIQNINAFLKVSELGSFSLAADALFITQPAVSKRIQVLEHAIDTKLIDRIGKGIRLTEAGRALIPGYKRIIEEIEESHRIVSNLREDVSGVLRFATSHHIGLHRLPPFLRQYSKQFPEVKLDINFMESEQAIPQILDGDIELAIITLPDATDQKLVMHKIWIDDMRCMVAKDHALAGRKTVTAEELLRYPAIMQTEGSHTRDLIDESLGTAGHIVFETNHLETIKAMVDIGLGWSILPETMTDRNIQMINIKGKRLVRELGIITHAARTLSNAGRAMIEILNR